jgi:hypothetical protein
MLPAVLGMVKAAGERSEEATPQPPRGEIGGEPQGPNCREAAEPPL